MKASVWGVLKCRVLLSCMKSLCCNLDFFKSTDNVDPNSKGDQVVYVCDQQRSVSETPGNGNDFALSPTIEKEIHEKWQAPKQIPKRNLNSPLFGLKSDANVNSNQTENSQLSSTANVHTEPIHVLHDNVKPSMVSVKDRPMTTGTLCFEMSFVCFGIHDGQHCNRCI